MTTLQTFTTPGTYIWTVPTGVTNVTFDVLGASGGGVVSVNHSIQTVVSQGGTGGEAKGKFAVVAGEKFEIVVGQAGGVATLGVQSASGGFPGGGIGDQNLATASGGGGGASDVRLPGRGNTCLTGKTCGYGDRIIVAGGGGGGSASGLAGEAGGGLTGGGNASSCFAQSASQECGGGLGQCYPPQTGLFGTGGNACPGTGWGGGGGGWYGGADSATSGTAGGGSGFISRFALSGSFPGGTNTGNGKVIITTTA